MARRNRPVARNQPQSATVTTVQTIEAVQYSGPLPHPDILAQYEAIVPGMADRLLQTFEKQSAHRMALEKKVIDGDQLRSWVGLILGFIFAVLLLGASVFMIASGLEVAGVGTIITVLATIVGSLIYSTETRRRERARKRD